MARTELETSAPMQGELRTPSITDSEHCAFQKIIQEALYKSANVLDTNMNQLHQGHPNSVADGRSFCSTSNSSSGNEKEIPDLKLPQQRYPAWARKLRWAVLSVYRRLNILVIVPNILAMVVLGVRHNLFRIHASKLALAVNLNILAALLIRQELVINLLFIVFGKFPQSFPLRIRCLAAKIYHLGGVHSGAAVAATIWFALFNVDVFRLSNSLKSATLQHFLKSITVLIDSLLLSIIATAHPTFRAKYHNHFEMTHRLAGWLATVLIWVQFGFLSEAIRRIDNPSQPLIETFVKSPVFYCLLLITISLVLPWLRLKKVPVHAEPLSNHAVRLHFTYTSLPLCAAPRLSLSPLKEWHAFAGIPEEDGNGFSVIVSKAGDWTSEIIRSPPTKLWVRGIPVRGVLHVAPMFKRIVLVATGSGIGPVLSLLYARQLSCRILWSTRDPEATYQKSILKHVRLADPDAIIVNTTVAKKRQDLVQLAYELYKNCGAEAVFLISNATLTKKFVFELESRGVPTFAPIFDS